MVQRTPTRKRPKPAIRRLSDVSKRIPKMGIFGKNGTGKTYTFLGPLLAGERLMGISTDFGGDGMDTISGALHELGRPELVENIKWYNLEHFEHIMEFCNDARAFVDPAEWNDPTVYFWDGATTAQIHSADEFALDPSLGTTGTGSSVARQMGLLAEQRDWDVVKRLTLRPLIKFLYQGVDEAAGRYPAKIVTYLENQKEDRNTGKMETGPYIQGAARGSIAASFDIFLRTYSEKDRQNKNKTNYFYQFRGDTDKLAVKVRGRAGVPDECSADPEQLWKALVDPTYRWV